MPTPPEPTAESPVPVVAAVIRRASRFLVCRRPTGKRHAGMWEFPGGKLLDGESLADAAERELREELAVELVAVGDALGRIRDPGSVFEIHFVPAEIRGTPRALEHDELAWCDIAALLALDLAPADLRFVRGHLGVSDD